MIFVVILLTLLTLSICSECVNLHDFTGVFERIKVNPFATMDTLIFDRQFRPALQTLNDCAAAHDLTILANSAYRNKADQQRLIRLGYSPSSTSNHRAGRAIDLNLEFASGSRCGTTCLQNRRGSVGEFITCARDAGLRWGGTFAVRDPVHFDTEFYDNVGYSWYQTVVDVLESDYKLCFENDESQRDFVNPLPGNGVPISASHRLPLAVCAAVEQGGNNRVSAQPVGERGLATFTIGPAESVVPVADAGVHSGSNMTVVRLSDPITNSPVLGLVQLDDFVHCVDAVPDNLPVCEGPPPTLENAVQGILNSPLVLPTGGLPLHSTKYGLADYTAPYGAVLRVVASRTDVRGPAYSSTAGYGGLFGTATDPSEQWVAVRLVAVPPNAVVPDSAIASIYYVQLGQVHVCTDDEVNAASKSLKPPCPSLVAGDDQDSDTTANGWLREADLAQCKVDEAVWDGSECTGFGQTGVCVADVADCPTTAYRLTSTVARSPILGCDGVAARYCCLPNTECQHRASGSQGQQTGVCADSNQCVYERFGVPYASSSVTSGCGPFPGNVRCCILKKPNPCSHRDGTPGVCIPDKVCTDALGGSTQSGRCTSGGDATRNDVKCCVGTLNTELAFDQGYDIADIEWGGYLGGQLGDAGETAPADASYTALIGGLSAAGAVLCCLLIAGVAVIFRRSVRNRQQQQQQQQMQSGTHRRRATTSSGRSMRSNTPTRRNTQRKLHHGRTNSHSKSLAHLNRNSSSNHIQGTISNNNINNLHLNTDKRGGGEKKSYRLSMGMGGGQTSASFV